MQKKLVLMILMLFISVSAAYADDFAEISAQDLKAKMDAGEKLLLLNPLSDIEFNQQNIPGSISIPLHLIEKSDKLPADKNALIITYCLGRKCIMSVYAADLLKKMGYTNIIIFKDGIPGWAMAGYQLDTSKALPKSDVPTVEIDELKAMVDKAFILDIREADIFKEVGHIKGCFHVELALLSSKLSDIPKDKPIIVVDHAGKQVLNACLFLKNNGYSDVKRFQGGMMEWLAKGNEVEK